MNYEEYKTVEEERIKRNILLLEEGVIITDIKNAYIDPLAKIGEGTVIEPNVLIQGNTVIGRNCIIGA
ncbi:MAG: UDP-N-acetylglucosamine diphosphorylase, partial [Clostridiales bacterium]|nr:UDP-N-acetylglucosamine diphosphorylase [Clostridiales bacterium]